MTTTPPIPVELQKEIDEVFAMYPRMAARLTHLRTIFESTPLSREAVDLWVEDVKSVTTDFLTLTGNARDLIRRILKDQEQS